MNRTKIIFYLSSTFLALIPFQAFSQTLPGSADSSRIDIHPRQSLEIPKIETAPHDRTISVQSPPDGAEEIKFILRGVMVEGNTVFSEKSLQGLYSTLIGHDVSLAVAWDLAAKITNQYRNSGYFLSRVSHPL